MGGITFFPLAFSSKEELVRTLFHEKQHVEQFRAFGVEYVQQHRGHFEKLAYEAENRFIQKLKKGGAFMKSFINNLVLYIQTGKTGSCPFCGTDNVKVEESNIGRHSFTLSCSECGKSDHYDGVSEKQ